MSLTAKNGVLFQSTLSQGERQVIRPLGRQIEIFQSTLSQGERLPPQCICAPEILHFNPRSRKESDRDAVKPD